MLERSQVCFQPAPVGFRSALPGARRTERQCWLLAIAGFAAVLFTLKGPNVLADPDTYWHLATGQLVLSTHSLPLADPFSHTAFGKEWILFEWLSQVVFAAFARVGGWTAVALLCFVVAAVSVLLLARHMLRDLNGLHALAVCVLAVALALPHFLARPHVLAWPVMILWTSGLVRAVDEHARSPLWLIPVMTLWANLHGSFVLGLGLMAMLAFEGLIAGWSGPNRRNVFARWAVFSMLAVTAGMLTPQGVGNIAHIVSVQGQPVQMGAISEWQPSSFRELQPFGIWLAVFVLVVLTLGVRAPIVRVGAVMVLLVLALRHVRHVELVGFLVPILLSKALGEALASRSTAPLPFGNRTLLAIGAGSLAFVVAFASWTDFAPARENSPGAAINAFGPAGPPGSVLNDYDFGGFLISQRIPTFVDGRSDLFGDKFLSEYIKATTVEHRDAILREYLDQHGISWTIFGPSRPAVTMLDRLPGWRRAYSDDLAVVHVRDPQR